MKPGFSLEMRDGIFDIIAESHRTEYLRSGEMNEHKQPPALCGANAHGGPCALPAGHNIGNLDIPSNHQAAFEREERYIVIKIKDLKYASAENRVHRFLRDAGIRTRECVVVESDWPEYEPVWKMIEARVKGEAK